MKNSFSTVKSKISSRYSLVDDKPYEMRSTNINSLLNRARLGKKKESRNKLLFTAATSFGLVLFGILIF